MALDFFQLRNLKPKELRGPVLDTFGLFRNSNNFEWTVFLESHCLVGSQALSLQIKEKAEQQKDVYVFMCV